MNFKLRPWKLNDLDSLVRNADNFNVVKFLSDGFPHPYTIEDGKSFIASAMQDNPSNKFAIEIDGQATGGIGIHPKSGINRKNAEIGYWLGELFWGQGIVTAAVREITQYGFKTYDINRIFAKTFSINLASQKVLEKAGFVLECQFEKTLFKNGEYLDELIYAVRI